MQKEFPLAPLGRFALLGLWLPLVLAMAVIVGAALLESQQTVPRSLLFALPLMLLVGAALTLALRRRRITVEHRELQVLATLHRKRVPVEAIDLAKARVVSLEEHTELRPMVKTRGFRLPGFAAGHFRLRNLGKAFCLITDRTRVLVLPLHEGGLVLLSPEKPRDLLDYLRELAQSPPHR